MENAASWCRERIQFQPLSRQQILQRHELTARKRQEAEDISVCDEGLLIHSNDEWMACDLLLNWNLLPTQPVSIATSLNEKS